jgi:hypothetical protein
MTFARLRGWHAQPRITVYESPVVTGTSSASAMVTPASPTTDVNAPKTENIRA